MYNPEIHAENRKYTIGQLLDQQVAADAPTRLIRDFLPDGTPYVIVVTTGRSAITLNEVMRQLLALQEELVEPQTQQENPDGTWSPATPEPFHEGAFWRLLRKLRLKR